jgi:hypothetical protein
MKLKIAVKQCLQITHMTLAICLAATVCRAEQKAVTEKFS